MDIPEMWMPTIKQHNRRTLVWQTTQETFSKDRTVEDGTGNRAEQCMIEKLQ